MCVDGILKLRKVSVFKRGCKHDLYSGDVSIRTLDKSTDNRIFHAFIYFYERKYLGRTALQYFNCDT